MAFVPQFKLYASNGLTLIYTFPIVYKTNFPQPQIDYVEVTSLRSQGSIIIPGGDKPWDLELNFALVGEDYETVAGLLNTLETTVLFNTPYVLKIDKSPTTKYEYNIKRLVPFEYEESLRTDIQKVRGILRVNSW